MRKKSLLFFLPVLALSLYYPMSAQLSSLMKNFDVGQTPARQADEGYLDYTWYQDLDGDGYGNPDESTTTTTETAPDGYVADNTDCDDGVAAYHPGAVWYKDFDGDLYSDGSTAIDCFPPNGYYAATDLTSVTGDCNDEDSYIYPGIWYLDFDQDGYGNGISREQCARPTMPSGEYWKRGYQLQATSGDCNDENPDVHPNGDEVCGNGFDDNCNSLTDEDCGAEGDSDGDGVLDPEDCAPNDDTKWRSAEMFKDNDLDGYYVSVGEICYGAEVPEGYVLDGFGTDDCDDNNNYVYVSYPYYVDNDGDGVGSDQIVEVCVRFRENTPEGYSEETGDCDDNDPAVQSDCAVFIWYRDLDGDGYGNPDVSTTTNTDTVPDGYVANNTDCNDDDSYLYPGIWYLDFDHDGYGSGISMEQCARPTMPSGEYWKRGYELQATSGDCNDENPDVHPNGGEVCGNGFDDNCNSLTDEDCGAEGDSDGDGVLDPEDCAPNDDTKWRSAEMFKDNDLDGYYVSVGEICYGAEVPEGYVLDGFGTDDCDDNNNYVYVSYPYYVDNDGDGIGSDQIVEVCVRFRENTPEGYSEETGDCDDNDPAVQSDCAVFIWYRDLDGDGYGNPNVSTTTNTDTAPDGYVANNTDCADNNQAVHPTAPEVLGNGIDDNCDGYIDDDPCPVPTTRLYVNKAAVANGNGSGWNCAIKELREAVAIANSNTNIREIWVAKGIYKPTAGTDRNASITITNSGLEILGGFTGTETAAWQANPIANTTIISGDIGVANNMADNSYHLLRVPGLYASSAQVIDGFHFEKANANSPNQTTGDNFHGAALVIYSSNPGMVQSQNASLTIRRCFFIGNTASLGGGAVSINKFNNVFIDSCLFTGNSAANGGALGTYESHVNISNSLFSKNSATAGNGGAVFNAGNYIYFVTTAFDQNTATGDGGAYFQQPLPGGGAAGFAYYKQCVFSRNSAARGGAAYLIRDASIENCTFFNNIAGVTGGAMLISSDLQYVSLFARNNIFWKNQKGIAANIPGSDITFSGSKASGYFSVNFRNNILQPKSNVFADNGTSISGNLRGIDPLFVNEAMPAGADGLFLYQHDGLELKNTSPAKNIGLGGIVLPALTDMLGQNRYACGDIDLGPYENQNCASLITRADFEKTPLEASVTNPFRNSLLIRYTGAEKADVEISSLTGQKVWKGNAIQKGQTQVNTASWPSGMYQVTIRTAASKPIVLKVIKAQ